MIFLAFPPTRPWLGVPTPPLYLCVLCVCLLVCLCSFATLSLGADSIEKPKRTCGALACCWPASHTSLPLPTTAVARSCFASPTKRAEYEEEGRALASSVPLGLGQVALI